MTKEEARDLPLSMSDFARLLRSKNIEMSLDEAVVGLAVTLERWQEGWK